jgi:archaellum component FlaC
MSEEKLSNKYRDNIKVDELREGINALRREVDAIKVDLTSFYGAMFQSGIIELVKDEEDNVVNKINKVVLVDESVQQD